VEGCIKICWPEEEGIRGGGKGQQKVTELYGRHAENSSGRNSDSMHCSEDRWLRGVKQSRKEKFEEGLGIGKECRVIRNAQNMWVTRGCDMVWRGRVREEKVGIRTKKGGGGETRGNRMFAEGTITWTGGRRGKHTSGVSRRKDGVRGKK